MLKRTALILLLILTISNAQAQFDGGVGTGDDPLQVATLEQLQEIRNHPDKHFIQVDDINAGETADWNEGKGFQPIGDNANKFTGSYEGGGYEISNLTINRSDNDHAGLFGYLDSGKIQNVSLVNVRIAGQSNVGGLIGENNSGKIHNAHVTGIITGSGWAIGGLIGRNNGEIQQSSAAVNISGNGWAVGGLIGRNNGEINFSHATGNLSGSMRVGGLIGFNAEKGNIYRSYATGEVSGTGEQIGGLIGGNSGEVFHSHSIGNVSGYSRVGGLIGFNSIEGLSHQSSASGDVSGTGEHLNTRIGLNFGEIYDSSGLGEIVTQSD